ncbi:hypothetical protein Sps_00859 [Shewanella psychrophila]|uniref:Uncharacterized protein n=1 Tax=Shewanella psychrophila TaxID=225848 RepID=A0A1S6HKJ2_9GAMM|nr:hypothetical protein [Shewanella psychrophila]AQS36051.1 hypothetical protein Sps_00859 [Shewanella psychrophila]
MPEPRAIIDLASYYAVIPDLFRDPALVFKFKEWIPANKPAGKTVGIDDTIYSSLVVMPDLFRYPAFAFKFKEWIPANKLAGKTRAKQDARTESYYRPSFLLCRHPGLVNGFRPISLLERRGRSRMPEPRAIIDLASYYAVIPDLFRDPALVFKS